MLTSDASKSILFLDISSLIENIGYSLVEVSKSEVKNNVKIRVLCHKRDGSITTDDLEKIYNLIYPRLSLTYSRSLELEVSSPGISRNFKDTIEFKIFRGERVRAYSNKYSCYVTGDIKDADDESVTLSSYIIEDRKESGEEIKLEYSDIAKAKLDDNTEAKEK